MNTHRLVGAVVVALGGVCHGQLAFSEISDLCGLNGMFVTIENSNYDHMGGGGTVIDANVDGHPDFFMLGGSGGPDRLFINNGAGQFFEMADAWGVRRTHRGMAASVGDFDNDGFPDMYVTSRGDGEDPMPDAGILYRNVDGTMFVDVTAGSGLPDGTGDANGMGSAWGDYDLDGDLDLFICSWGLYADNLLFENQGDGTFVDVSDAVIPESARSIHGFTPRFLDMDGDLDPELLIAADFGTSAYLVNNDGVYADHSGSGMLFSAPNGMGSTVFDIDGDGHLDWFVTAIYFIRNLVEEVGNAAYIWQGNHVFQDQALDRGVIDSEWAWGTAAADLDNDADEDLLVTNGFLTWDVVPTKLWANDGTGHFTDMSVMAGTDITVQGRNLVTLDIEPDGDLDFIVTTYLDGLFVFRNDVDDANSVRVRLDPSPLSCVAPMGYGAFIEASIDGTQHIRAVDGSHSYLGQSEMVAHFGLGAASQVDQLRVRWPDGSMTVLADVPAGSMLTIGKHHAGDVNEDDALDIHDVIFWLGLFASEDVAADLNGDTVLDIFDVTLFLAQFSGPC